MSKRNTIRHNFSYHPPRPEDVEKFQNMRRYGLSFAEYVEQLPNSREKSLALTKIEEAVMWANAAIARDGDPEGSEWE